MHAVEGNSGRKVYVLTALIGGLATIVLWWVHFTHPAIFGDAFRRGRVSPTSLLFVLAPPFILTFGLANSLLFKAESNASVMGPMWGYLRNQESERKWKIM